MYHSITDKITLNNGYKMPPVSACGDMEDSDDLELWKQKHPGEVPFQENIEEYLKCGYRSFDTGKRYGTEEVLGKVFRECGIPREELYLTTKVYHDEHGYDRTLKYVDSVLKKTGLDYIDLFLIHCPVTCRGLYAQTYKALAECCESGVIRAVGVSNFTVQHYYELAEISGIVPAVNQREQHPYYVQHNLLAYERKHGIIPQSYSPIGQGKYVNDKRLEWIAQRHEKSIAQVILRWHLQKGFMLVTRTCKKYRMQENADIFDFELSAEEMAFMETLNRGERNWHDPMRFPGSCFYYPVEKTFKEAVEKELESRYPDKALRECIRKRLDECMQYQDVDGTKDAIIFCFARAEAKYGKNPGIPAQAEKEATLLAGEMIRWIENQEVK